MMKIFHTMDEINQHQLYRSLLLWIEENINIPIRGFEHKKNHNGTFFTEQQQLIATHEQIIFIVKDFLKRGKTEEEIRQNLLLFV